VSPDPASDSSKIAVFASISHLTVRAGATAIVTVQGNPSGNSSMSGLAKTELHLAQPLGWLDQLAALLARELAPSSRKFRTALRLATIGTLGAGLIASCHVNSGFGTYAVWLLVGAGPMMSPRKASAFLIAEALALSTSVVMARILVEAPWLMLPFLFASISLSTYVGAIRNLGSGLLLIQQRAGLHSDVRTHPRPRLDARIFQSPFNEGNRKIAVNRHVVPVTVDQSFDGKVMLGSVQQHAAAHRDREFSLYVAVTDYLLRSETDIREAAHFQDAGFHPVVANGMSTVAARGVDDDDSVRLTGSWVETDYAVLECKGALRVMRPSFQ
jgi:hypothetical protein